MYSSRFFLSDYHNICTAQTSDVLLRQFSWQYDPPPQKKTHKTFPKKQQQQKLIQKPNISTDNQRYGLLLFVLLDKQ